MSDHQFPVGMFAIYDTFRFLSVSSVHSCFQSATHDANLIHLLWGFITGGEVKVSVVVQYGNA